MRPSSFAAALLTLAAAVPAAAQDSAPSRRDGEARARLDRQVAARVAGAPVSCIPLRPNTRSEVIAGEAIVYRDGSRLWVNRPRIGADRLTRDSILASRPVIGQLCRLEPIQLVDRVSGINLGFVTLGDFTPYTRPKAAD